MKVTAFFNVAPCSLVKLTNVSEVLTASNISNMIALMIEAVSTYKT
jgi:hypothetical protein